MAKDAQKSPGRETASGIAIRKVFGQDMRARAPRLHMVAEKNTHISNARTRVGELVKGLSVASFYIEGQRRRTGHG